MVQVGALHRHPYWYYITTYWNHAYMTSWSSANISLNLFANTVLIPYLMKFHNSRKYIGHVST